MRAIRRLLLQDVNAPELRVVCVSGSDGDNVAAEMGDGDISDFYIVASRPARIGGKLENNTKAIAMTTKTPIAIQSMPAFAKATPINTITAAITTMTR